jgi:hypothetical protein
MVMVNFFCLNNGFVGFDNIKNIVRGIPAGKVIKSDQKMNILLAVYGATNSG